MEKYKELISLCKREQITDSLYSIGYKNIVEKAEELHVIGIFEESEYVRIQLSSLKYLLEIDSQPKRYLREENIYYPFTYYTHKDDICFFVLLTEEEHEEYEEHKKAQAI